MKPKPIYFFTLLLILMSAYSPSHAQGNLAETKAINFLNEFYTVYINTISSVKPPAGKIMDSIERKYCSERFLAKIKKEELDADPFINAQDSDPPG